MIIKVGTLPPPNGKLMISSKIARWKNPHIDARSRHYRYLTTVIPTHIINNSLINKRKYNFSKPYFQHPPPPKSGLAHEAFLRKPPSASYPLTPDRRKTPAGRAVRRLALKGGPPVHGRRPHPHRHARPLTLTSCPATTGHLNFAAKRRKGLYFAHRGKFEPLFLLLQPRSANSCQIMRFVAALSAYIVSGSGGQSLSACIWPDAYIVRKDSVDSAHPS